MDQYVFILLKERNKKKDLHIREAKIPIRKKNLKSETERFRERDIENTVGLYIRRLSLASMK